jgi:NDP-sugar pyrophosphorylase family protein
MEETEARPKPMVEIGGKPIYGIFLKFTDAQQKFIKTLENESIDYRE